MKIQFASLVDTSLRSMPKTREIAKKIFLISRFFIEKLKSIKRPAKKPISKAKPITPNGGFFFFGYYDKCPWHPTEPSLLCLKANFDDRMPQPEDVVTICLINEKSGTISEISKSRAWCWQQGNMLTWTKRNNKNYILFNDFRKGRYCSVLISENRTHEEELPLPIYAINKDGNQALSVDFGRLEKGSPGYGYRTTPYLKEMDLRPKNNGIWYIDLLTKNYQLILSIAEVVGNKPRSDFIGAFHYFNHLEFNPNGKQFVFFHRWCKLEPNGAYYRQTKTRMYTAKPDGTNLRLLLDHDFISHFTWRNDTQILVWARHPKSGCGFYLIDVVSDEIQTVGNGLLTSDGHPSYSPDKRWLITDTYPNDLRIRTLILYDTKQKKRFDIAQYHTPFRFDGPLRCDLHPRWNRGGTKVCIDSVHEGKRAVYIVNLFDFIEQIKCEEDRNMCIANLV